MTIKRKQPAQPVSVRLGPELQAWVEKICQEEGISKGSIIRRALLQRMRAQKGKVA